ncbi:MAG TPA: hypothetical protein VIL09_18420 [Microvirga sp.]|jgi:hypothetical protein
MTATPSPPPDPERSALQAALAALRIATSTADDRPLVRAAEPRPGTENGQAKCERLEAYLQGPTSFCA